MEGGEGEEQSEELSVGEYFYQIYWIKLWVWSRDKTMIIIVSSLAGFFYKIIMDCQILRQKLVK